MKTLSIILIAVLSFCSNVVGQDLKIGVSSYNKEEVIRLVLFENDELKRIKKVFKETQESFDFKYMRAVETSSLYIQQTCVTLEHYNSIVNYINYIQEEYKRQHQLIDSSFSEIEAQIFTSFEPILDTILIELARKNNLDAILNEDYVEFSDTLINYTSEILLEANKAAKQFEVTKRVDWIRMIEKFEKEHKVIFAKNWEDFPYETTN